ncbi:MAG: DUF6470 family protein [Bacillota bacterium]|nr:DUF6470 family protein [Bacillota bacterium]
MQLRIEQVWGQIGVRQTPPSIELTISDPKLDIKTQLPVLTFKPDRLELSIDAKPCREDLQIFDVLAFSRFYASQASMKLNEAVAQTAAEGDRLASIENGEANVIADIAWENSLGEECEVALAPVRLPDISFRVIEGERSFRGGYVKVRFEPGEMRVKLHPGAVRVFLRRPPELHIHAVGSPLDVQA